MLKEAKNIDFYTTGKEPSAEDFARISDWIRKKKEKTSKAGKTSTSRKRSKVSAGKS